MRISLTCKHNCQTANDCLSYLMYMYMCNIILKLFVLFICKCQFHQSIKGFLVVIATLCSHCALRPFSHTCARSARVQSKLRIHMYHYMYSISMARIQNTFILFKFLRCKVHVNKMSPYSNSDYLSSTVSIVQ